MREPKPEIEINLNYEELILHIYEEQDNSLFEISENEAFLHGESRYQLLESRNYGFYLSDENFQLKVIPGIVSISRGKEINGGRITPGIFVGTLPLEVCEKSNPGITVDMVELEVLATKLDLLNEGTELDENYRSNFRKMLEDISGKCSDLLLQINSPVSQNFEPDFDRETATIYQRFAFVKSLVASVEFNDAVNLILYAPSAKWKETHEIADIRRTRRFSNSSIRQIISGTNRFEYELNEHVHSLPIKILGNCKTETFDTPENRFVKYTLGLFAQFCEKCEVKFRELNYSKAELEAKAIVGVLRNYLEASLFKEVSRPETLNLNSPLLQRKNGYREVLNAWMLFDLAAKLIWKGGDNVYRAGKRDIAILYEYWLFFQLYDLFVNKFEINQIIHADKTVENLIDKEDIIYLTEETKDGLGLKLRSGIETTLIGKTRNENRELNIRFSYNRTYSGGTKYHEKDGSWSVKEGSWTKPMRPDYTISIWPSSLEVAKAEKEDMIVHIHFDAKYKVKHFQINSKVIEETDESGEKIDSIEKEKREERKGVYKNADLLKMHAYKDAIRRTSGAYVLYPGEGESNETNSEYHGFHELIPGLGAFAIRPSGDSNTGIAELSVFIDRVIIHFQDRANQRERLASKVYDIHKTKKQTYKEDGTTLNITNEPMPEMIDGEKLIPDETFVLVGYYKTTQQLTWILDKDLYNFRTGLGKGSLALGQKELGAKFLVLHGPGETKTKKIYQLKEKGPKIYSKQDLIDDDYPTTPKGDAYIMFEIEKEITKEFANSTFDLTKLSNFKNFWNSPKPITVSLSELMKVVDHYSK